MEANTTTQVNETITAGQTTVSNSNDGNATQSSTATDETVASGAGKTLTQDEVNAIVKDRLARQEKADTEKFLKQLGVEKPEDIDSIVKKAQSYDTTKKAYDETAPALKTAREELTLIKNDIEPNRYEDVRLHFKGKGVELTEEALKAELATHPEWKSNKQVIQPKQPETTTITSLGTPVKPNSPVDIKEQVMAYFK